MALLKFRRVIQHGREGQELKLQGEREAINLRRISLRNTAFARLPVAKQQANVNRSWGLYGNRFTEI